MELVLAGIVIVVVAALIYFNRSARSLDINQDGKVDADDAVQAVTNAAQGVKQTAKKAAVRAKAATKSTQRSGTKKPAAKKPRAPKK